MPTTFGAFRNDGDDGDDGDLFPNDGDDGDDGDRTGLARTNALVAQAMWRTRGDLLSGIAGIGNPVWTAEPLGGKDIFGRWSKKVRARLYSFELLSRLHFEKGADGGTLWSLEAGEDRKFVPKEIKTLKRPLFDSDEEAFRAALSDVIKAQAALRPRRMPEILSQVYLPYPYFARLLNLQPGRHRYTYELMSAVFAFSSTVVMQFKNHLKVRRPADRSPLVQPMLPTPGHGSYPAGHATQCYFAANVLDALVQKKLGDDFSNQLQVLAKVIADNRVIAGLHYKPDNVAGEKLGNALAGLFFARKEVPDSALNWLWEQAAREWKNT